MLPLAFAVFLALPAFPAATPAAAAEAQATPQAPAASPVTGLVHDVTGAPVGGAAVTVRAAGGPAGGPEQHTTTGADGRFSVAAPGAGALEVTVTASGFQDARQTIPAGTRQNVDVALSPKGVQEEVTVTATRSETRIEDVPASVTVLSHAELERSPAVESDDVLRQVPTFSLFRRTSSIALHPTSQGVSLRGIGPSGVSRTLVLLDGVPVNDPFGGWVYWSRIPIQQAQRVEIVESASSSLYGNYAMGGVINILSAPPAPHTLDATLQYGSLNSPKADFRASDVWGKVGVTVNGSSYSTDGYIPVVPAERGLVDNKASVDSKDLNLRFDYDPAKRVHAFLQTGYFREHRNNGKASTIDGTEEKNDTQDTSASGGVRVALGDGSELQATVFGDQEAFHSNFLAVPTNPIPRSVGRMSLNQAVPTHDIGSMVQWSRALGSRQYFTAGGDWRWVRGDSNEQGLDATTGLSVILNRVSGGRQQSAGVFAEDLVTVSRALTVTLSARLDHWRSYDAHNLETNIPSGTPTAANADSLPDRSDTVGSPRAAALYRITDRVSAWGDFGLSFRAPTLNELYRQFRVGTTLTLPNNQLAPEHLKGGEAGVTITPARNVTWRTTWFDNRLRDPIFNVTTAVSGANVTQQRQNIPRTRVTGVQTDVDVHLGGFWHLAAGYVYESARVVEAPPPPAGVGSLQNNFLQQVPKNRGSVEVSYLNPRLVMVTFTVQAIGAQFDDDQNTPSRLLPNYAVVGLSVSRGLTRNLELFVGGQNLLNKTYIVATLPTLQGPPRMVSGGVRISVR